MNLPERVINGLTRLFCRIWWGLLLLLISILHKPIQGLAHWLNGHRNYTRSRHNFYRPLPPGFNPKTGRLQTP